jgi:hypothetical protein
MNHASSKQFSPLGNAAEVARIGWPFIAALTLGGGFSGAFASFIWFSIDVTLHSEHWFALLASLSLGLSIAGVLWIYRQIWSWEKVVAITFVTVAAHLTESFGWNYLPRVLLEDWNLPILGSITPEIIVRSFVVAWIVYTVCLFVIPPRRSVVQTAVIALTCSTLSATTITYIAATQRGAWFTLWTGNTLDLLWQMSLTFFLGIALWISHSKTRQALSEVHSSIRSPASTNRFAVLWILITYYVVVGFSSYSAHITAKIVQSQREAPSSQNLPEIKLMPIDDVLLMRGVAGWLPYQSGLYPQTTTALNGQTSAQSPNRLTYYARYATQGTPYAVQVNVTQYPNSDWARYELRNTPTLNYQFEHSDWLKTLSKFGNNLYQAGPYFYWSSSDKLVFVSCEGISPNVIEEFLNAYLGKYPSSI